MSGKETGFRLESSITGSVSLDVKVNTVGDGAFDTPVDFYWPGEDQSYGSLHLSAILTAARQFQPLTFTRAGIGLTEKTISLSPVAVLQCACFAQEKQLQALREHFARMQPPNVILEMNGGVINDVQSDQPLNLIVLDEDIEGADEDSIVEVSESEWYLQRFSVDQATATINQAHVYTVLNELLNQPKTPKGETP